MPPLLGLMHSSRRSTDIPLHHISQLSSNGLASDAVDSDISKEPTGTGSMIESVANMANSILGAGIIGSSSAISAIKFTHLLQGSRMRFARPGSSLGYFSWFFYAL